MMLQGLLQRAATVRNADLVPDGKFFLGAMAVQL